MAKFTYAPHGSNYHDHLCLCPGCNPQLPDEEEYRVEPVLEGDRFWCPQCKQEREDPGLSGFCSLCGHVLEYIDEGE